MAKGCLSIPAVWNVLEELEMENCLNMEDDDRMSTETMIGTTSSLITP